MKRRQTGSARVAFDHHLVHPPVLDEKRRTDRQQAQDQLLDERISLLSQRGYACGEAPAADATYLQPKCAQRAANVVLYIDQLAHGSFLQPSSMRSRSASWLFT